MTIPRAQVSTVMGLLEILHDFQGKVDLAKVADELRLELDDILPAVNAAKLLKLIQVNSGDLIITNEGTALLSKSISGRKKELNNMVSNLGEIKGILGFIRKEHGNEVTKEELLSFIKQEMPDVDAEQTFSWIVDWGRYALLLRYDSNSQKIKLTKSPTKVA
ncbi:MAG: AAA-associated domain-containing protein [Patescibacteria group bacterium]|nr:AAA-associated domain-containing protein [Patescibacteria group bacterium]